jgi:hypothetical protein
MRNITGCSARTVASREVRDRGFRARRSEAPFARPGRALEAWSFDGFSLEDRSLEDWSLEVWSLEVRSLEVGSLEDFGLSRDSATGSRPRFDRSPGVGACSDSVCTSFAPSGSSERTSLDSARSEASQRIEGSRSVLVRSARPRRP